MDGKNISFLKYCILLKFSKTYTEKMQVYLDFEVGKYHWKVSYVSWPSPFIVLSIRN